MRGQASTPQSRYEMPPHYRPVLTTVGLGSAVAMLLIGAGLIWQTLTGQLTNGPHLAGSISALLNSELLKTGTGLTNIGLVVLMITPIVSTVIAALSSLRRRHYQQAVGILLALAIMAWALLRSF